MRIGRILFLAIFLFSVTVIVGVSSFFEGLAYNSVAQLDLFDENGQFQIFSPKDSYQNEVLVLLKQFSQKQLSLDDLEGSLFDLKVPKAYQALHLALIASVEELDENPEQIIPAKERLERLKDQYSWLAAGLTLFLANIF